MIRLSYKWRRRLQDSNGRWRWPFVWKSDHEQSMWANRRDIEELRSEAARAKEDLARVVPKLCDVALVQDKHTCRVVVDFTPQHVQDAFMWGNDGHMLDILADQIRMYVLQELKTANMTRLDTYKQTTPIRRWL